MEGLPDLISSPFFLQWLNGTSFSEIDCIEIESLLERFAFHSSWPRRVIHLFSALKSSPWYPICRRNYYMPLTFQFVYAEPRQNWTAVCSTHDAFLLFQGPTVYLDPKRVQGCLVSVVLIMTPGIGCTEHHPPSRPLHSGPNPQMLKEAALQTAMTERESGSVRKKKNGKEKKGTLLLGRKRRIKTGWCCWFHGPRHLILPNLCLLIQLMMGSFLLQRLFRS